MSIAIRLPGVNFSNLGNPKCVDYIESFPATNLAALYSFESGTAGQPYTGPATDYSGNNQSARLIGASTLLKTTGGIANSLDQTRNAGGGIITPVTVTDKFTVFGVSRNLLAWDGVLANIFNMPWSLSGNWLDMSAPSMTDLVRGNRNMAGRGGVLHINQQMATSTSDNNAGIASLSWQAFETGAPSTAWAGNTRPAVALPNTAKNSWIAWALSFDRASGYTFRALGQGNTVTAPAHAETFAAAHISNGSKHLFGPMGYSSSQIVAEQAMAGVYTNEAKSVPDMDALIVAMKARLASRIPIIL